ncbi:hypothetical protein BDR06DRAFT_683231 [Suillus hirtellus]|nr:hypothetical protein BDR06DRAFT_683231 [Suillus hirtellus]
MLAQMFVLGPRLIFSVREYHTRLMAYSDAGPSMIPMSFEERVHISTGGALSSLSDHLTLLIHHASIWYGVRLCSPSGHNRTSKRRIQAFPPSIYTVSPSIHIIIDHSHSHSPHDHQVLIRFAYHRSSTNYVL